MYTERLRLLSHTTFLSLISDIMIIHNNRRIVDLCLIYVKNFQDMA